MYMSFGLLFSTISTFMLGVILLGSWCYVGYQILNGKKLSLHLIVFVLHFWQEEYDMFSNAKDYKYKDRLDWKEFLDCFAVLSLCTLAFMVLNYYLVQYIWVIYLLPMCVFFVVYAKIIDDYVSIIEEDDIEE